MNKIQKNKIVISQRLSILPSLKSSQKISAVKITRAICQRVWAGNGMYMPYHVIFHVTINDAINALSIFFVLNFYEIL